MSEDRINSGKINTEGGWRVKQHLIPSSSFQSCGGSELQGCRQFPVPFPSSANPNTAQSSLLCWLCFDQGICSTKEYLRNTSSSLEIFKMFDSCQIKMNEKYASLTSWWIGNVYFWQQQAAVGTTALLKMHWCYCRMKGKAADWHPGDNSWCKQPERFSHRKKKKIRETYVFLMHRSINCFHFIDLPV